MDHKLPHCLRALWHVYRKGLDWFQWCQSFRFELTMCFGPFALCVVACWWLGKTQDVLQFHINEMDRDLPSCLQALRHVYRRGLDWFQQSRSFRFGLTMCFGSFWLQDAHSGRNGRLYCNSTWARWIGSSVLVCGYFSMYTEEVWIGSNSVGLFV